MDSSIVVAALYKFVALPDFAELQAPIRAVCAQHGVLGTLLLAEEGINGTIAGLRRGIDAVLAHLRADPRLADLEHKESIAPAQPFYRLKVRLKREIVTMGVPDLDPATGAGTYVDPAQWNALIDDPDVLVIDTRNAYEVELGSFKNAVSPETGSFREFPDYVARELAGQQDRPIAMFCTGGIRCEKSTAYLKSKGFDQVYHLRGGILKYLEQTPPDDSRWQGDCFVFDHRVSVDAQLNPGVHAVCFACRMPVSPAAQDSPDYREGVHCPRCKPNQSAQDRARYEERQRQIGLSAERGEAHLGGAAERADPGTR